MASTERSKREAKRRGRAIEKRRVTDRRRKERSRADRARFWSRPRARKIDRQIVTQLSAVLDTPWIE